MNSKIDNSNNYFEERINNLSLKINYNLEIIKDVCSRINSFDLISYIFFYNHLFDSTEYADDRGDKHFFISEIIACQILKNNFVEDTSLSTIEILESFSKIQEAAIDYCMMSEISNGLKNGKGNIFNEIVNRIELTSKHVRNPGHPKHHLIFSEKLYKPFNVTIKNIFGFTLEDSIIIRDKISSFLNFKYNNEKEKVENKAKECSKEAIKFKHKKISKEQLLINIVNIDELITYTDQEIRQLCRINYLNNFYAQFSNVGTFSVKELSEFLDLEYKNVKCFLDLFSCTFNSLEDDVEIYQPISILKSKPIIKHKDKYIIPSIPLLIWVVEETFENEFRKNLKLYGKYISTKHDFLLNQGVEYFQKLLPTSEIETNLFYEIDGNRYETDGIILYNYILIIIEAKANKLSNKAKAGHNLKTKDHLNDIIKDSYNQALRTISYLKDNEVAIFTNKKKQKLQLQLKNFNEVIIVSLTLEQLGNIIPIIKTTDKLNYFEKNHFPWIISIYDLTIIKDFFETPSLLFYYLKCRNKFLNFENVYIYEELDIIGYFLKQRGNTLNNIIESKKYEGANRFYFEPETDYINNYYMYKYNYPDKYIKKPSYFKNKDFKDLIIKIDDSNLPKSIETSVNLMQLNSKSVNFLMNKIKQCKKLFLKDKQLHDCSILNVENENWGFTYMISNNEVELKSKLIGYIQFKKKQLFAKTWTGIVEIKNKIKYIYTV